MKISKWPFVLKKYDRQQVQISKVNVHKQIIRRFRNILNFFAIYRWEIQNSYVAMKPAVQRCSMFLIVTDDKGNQGLYRMTNYGDTETVFEESRNNTKYKGISPDAKTVTLELYVSKEEKNRTTYKKYETGTEDTYGEGEGRVYESDEDPLDLYSPVEGKIEIKIRRQKNSLIEERRRNRSILLLGRSKLIKQYTF